MKTEFKKISIPKTLHDKIKADREKYKLKSIGETILYYIGKFKK